ncbi:hypothetical protein EDC04DRAFT_2612938 [Pisolithus marmoratus]|nr:hypothetical protein EDC04DRAFT_2612938 [Pisolithus marmoratus]
MSNQAFCLTLRMINKEAFCLLSQYAMQVISLEHAMDKIQYVLGSDFDKDEWMDVMQCIIMDPFCFADMEKVFMERLAEKESSNATGLAHPSDKATQQWKDCKGEVGTSGKKVKVAIGDNDRDGMASTSGSLLKDLSAWHLMMDWAQDKIRYPDLDNKLRGFRLRYIHEEWQPLISRIFTQSDPSNKEPQPPTSLVEEAIQPNPPWSTVRCSSGKAPWNSKCQKTGISQFLDLAAKEDNSEDNYADEDIDETQGNAGHPMDAGPTRKSSFSHTIDGLMAQYSGPSQPHDIQKQKLPQILEGIPLPLMKNIYIVDLFLASAQSFVYEYMKSNGINQHGEKSFFSKQRAQWQLSLFLPTDERLEGNVNATGETIHCAIQELHRVFNTGQAVRITLEVSDLLLEAHMPDHVHSLATGHADTHIHLPKPVDVVLPGDTVNISQGAYKGTEAPIEWMSVDGTQAWIYVKETKYSSSQTGIHSTQGEDPDQQVQYSSTQMDIDDTLGMHPDWLVGYIMVPMNVHDVQSRGTVQTVHFDNAYLDFVCDTYGQKISILITFCHKVAECSGLQLSQWIGQDVWVICGEKKGYQGTLRTLRRDISCVALQGWLIQLKNDYIATLITPPPSAPPPSAIPENPSEATLEAWTTTADDLSSTDFGGIPWLFQANYCNFQHYQLGFTVNDQYRPYNNASLRAQEFSITLFLQLA